MKIAFGLYEGFTALDFVGPYNVLASIPGVDVVVCAASAGRVNDDNNLLHLDVEHDFASVPRPDILVVPGGFITRQLAADRHPIVDWIEQAHPHTTWTASVCTGALLLGAAGLLRGLRATTHWSAYEELASYGATPTEDRVVIEGKVATAAGVSAGIDLALTIAARQWGGAMAQCLQLGIEYDPQPPFDSGSPSKASPEILELVRAAMGSAG